MKPCSSSESYWRPVAVASLIRPTAHTDSNVVQPEVFRTAAGINMTVDANVPIGWRSPAYLSAGHFYVR